MKINIFFIQAVLVLVFWARLAYLHILVRKIFAGRSGIKLPWQADNYGLFVLSGFFLFFLMTSLFKEEGHIAKTEFLIVLFLVSLVCCALIRASLRENGFLTGLHFVKWVDVEWFSSKSRKLFILKTNRWFAKYFEFKVSLDDYEATLAFLEMKVSRKNT